MASKKAKKNIIIDDLIMVKLHIEFDTGYRSSKEMQDLIAEEKKATKTALRTGIMVIPKKKTSPFTSAVSSLRQYYLDNSLPWEKGNWRVVPVTAWQEFKDDIEELIRQTKDRFKECYIDGYDDLKSEHEKEIGDLKVEFPKKQDLEDRFRVEYKMGATASPEDIRIKGIDEIQRKAISESMKDRYDKQIGEGLGELAKRLLSAAENISERVSDEDQKGKKYTRTMENLAELAETAEKLNVTGNEAIAKAAATIREDIAQWKPENIKDTKAVRDHIADSAGSVQDTLAGLSI